MLERRLAHGAEWDDPEITADLQRVEIDVAEALGETHPLVADRQMLRRFIVARKGSEAAILAMIEAHMAWRERQLPVVLTEAVVAELKKGKIEVFGHDALGRPLVVVRSSRFDPKARDLAVCVSAAVYLVERALASLGDGTPPQVTLFYDRQGFSLRRNWDLEYLK